MKSFSLDPAVAAELEKHRRKLGIRSSSEIVNGFIADALRRAALEEEISGKRRKR